MYGGDLTRMRPVELRLLTNPEVLGVNRNSTRNRQLFREGDRVAWVADVPGTGDKYLALFNLGEEEGMMVPVQLADLGFQDKVEIRDLWRRKDLGEFDEMFSPVVPPHGSRLFKLTSSS
jgi:alpha-galactosidase